MQSLIGKKVWVVQYDDEEDSVYGIVHSIADGFIAIRRAENDEEPTLFVNLQNVKEIERFYEQEGNGKLMLLRPSREGGQPN